MTVLQSQLVLICFCSCSQNCSYKRKQAKAGVSLIYVSCFTCIESIAIKIEESETLQKKTVNSRVELCLAFNCLKKVSSL